MYEKSSTVNHQDKAVTSDSNPNIILKKKKQRHGYLTDVLAKQCLTSMISTVRAVKWAGLLSLSHCVFPELTCFCCSRVRV